MRCQAVLDVMIYSRDMHNGGMRSTVEMQYSGGMRRTTVGEVHSGGTQITTTGESA